MSDFDYDYCSTWDDYDAPPIDYTEKIAEAKRDSDEETIIYDEDDLDQEVNNLINKPSIFSQMEKPKEVITLESSSSPQSTQTYSPGPYYDYEAVDYEAPNSPIVESELQKIISRSKPPENSELQKIISSGKNPVEKPELSKVKKPTESKEEKERKKIERDKAKEEKKQEKAREKQFKATLAAQQRNLKPEEAIKRLTVHIDTEVVNSTYGSQIIPILQKDGITYRVESLPHSNTMSWSKIVKDSYVDDMNELVQVEKSEQTEHIVEIIGIADVVSAILNDELLLKAKTLISVRSKVRLTLVIVGLEKYLSAQKSKINKALKTAVTGSQLPGRSRKKDQNVADMTEEELEMALTELQLLTNTCHRFVESPEAVAAIVSQLTRSISQVDYKREKYSKDADVFSFFARGEGKDGKKVDKNGVGLLELWQQQICQFNNVGLEVSQAIVSQYGSPQQLMQAYRKCATEAEAAALLENIPVRRDAGILSSNRRIGPELSRKIHRFFTAKDSNIII